jgi:hypothetical protein
VRYRIPDGAAPRGLRRDAYRQRIVEFSPQDLTRAIHDLTGWALDHGFALDDLHIVRPSLEDVHLQLTGEPQ